MQKIIRKIVRGEIPNSNIDISFSTDYIAFEVFANDVYEGEFSMEFKNCNNDEIEGKIFSTNSRMECINSELVGNKQYIRYRFDSRGLHTGNNSEGDFYFVFNQIESSIHFHATVVDEYVNSAVGKLYDLDDFSRLAKANWHEALRIFYSPFFENNILKKTTLKYKNRLIMAYKGLNVKEHNSHNLEEFLELASKKEKIDFEVTKDKYNFFSVNEKIKEYLEIRKSSWGYFECNISTDSEFIELNKTCITTDDFMGNTLQYAFYLNEEKMHEGKNFGKITISNATKKVSVEIIAQKNDDFKEIVESVKHKIKDYKIGLMELYVQYRLKRIGTGAWANETLNILQHLVVLEKENKLFYRLMMAQTYIYNHEIEEAQVLLNKFEAEVGDENVPEYGYYLFLCTLFEREPANVDECEEKIEKIFKQHPNNAVLFWVLSFLNAKYIENPGEKLKAIKYWDGIGKNSPYFLCEAYYIIWQDPFLLDKIEEFEIRMLMWALRNKAFTEEVMDQFFLATNSVKNFDFKVFSIMEEGYKYYSKESYLSTICSYLIKAQKFDKKYHKWYEMGVNYNLRITKLYEAFLLSADENDMNSLPDMVKRYFQYENNIPSNKLAILYKNIIIDEVSDPSTYEKYKDIMREFAFDQIKKKHINESYAVIYQEIFKPEIINAQIAGLLSEIIFTNKIIVKSDEIVRVYVYEKWRDVPLEVGLSNHEGFFFHVSNDYELIFEDRDGKRYGQDIESEIRPLFDIEKYKKVISEQALKNQNYFIYSVENDYFSEKNSFEEIEFLNNGQIACEFVNRLYFNQALYYDQMKDSIKCGSCLKKIDSHYINDEKIKKLAELYLKYKQYRAVVEILKNKGIDLINASDEVGITKYLVKNGGSDEKFIISLAMRVFKSGHYNTEIIEYLSLNYEGPTIIMTNLWSIAHDIVAKTGKLEEKIINNILYTSIDIPMKNRIFLNYCENGGKEITIIAYITKMMHDYFVNDKTITGYIIGIVEEKLKNGALLNETCKLGLLKYYSNKNSFTDEEEDLIDMMLGDFALRDLNFEFFKTLPNKIVEKYHIRDKVYIEFKGKPNDKVMIEYKFLNDFESSVLSESQKKVNIKTMHEIYAGIYSISITAFFGETISYKIFKDSKNGYKVLKNNTVNNYDLRNNYDKDRYNRLNEMVVTSRLKEADIEHELSEYKNLDELTKKIFTIM